MKTIYVVRHAKASLDFPNLPDVDRPIIEKGINKTKKIINELNIRNVSVDLLISSHAKRALETAKMIATGINYPVEKIEINKQIYKLDCDDVFDVFSAIDKQINSVMLVGHNPTLSQFANLFFKEKIDFLPTSGVVSLSFETEEWRKISKAKVKINFCLIPKLLP